MNTTTAPIIPIEYPVQYPESDGEPIAESTLQYQWIVTISSGLEVVFADHPNVFVAADLFWYPVEGRQEIVAAPDAMVVFGRPKGHRPSYKQWEEGNLPPQVVFEVVSPSNRVGDTMERKLEFYRQYGVEEYYLYDPDPKYLQLRGYLRSGAGLVEVRSMHRHVSRRLGIRFEMPGDELTIYGPDGKPFITPLERYRLEVEARRRAELERQRAEREHQEVLRLRERLRLLGQDPD